VWPDVALNEDKIKDARIDLIEKLAEATKYTNEKCEDWEIASARLRAKLDEGI
jgi:hypothetical protein